MKRVWLTRAFFAMSGATTACGSENRNADGNWAAPASSAPPNPADVTPAFEARKPPPVDPQKDATDAVEAFHKLYYNTPWQTWGNTRWMGVPIQKNPLDMWIYQEIIASLEPDFIIEAGTAAGGSALFMAHMLDIIGKGQIVTVDIAGDECRQRFAPQPNDRFRVPHPRVSYIRSSSTDPSTIENIKNRVCEAESVLVILDSDHRRDHVLSEMRAYGELVTQGSYMIVEDTNINGHPVHPEHGPGPMEALHAFMEENDQFEVDKTREKFFFTQNPMGYLKRKTI